MTFDGLSVNHGSLDQASQDLTTAAKDIEARLDRLEGELKPLQSDWSGQAKEAYRRAKAEWDSAINEMVQLLAKTGQTVSSSNQEYLQADKRGAQRFPA